MVTFNEMIDEMLGDDNSLNDIRLVVRRLWFYDFEGYPIRFWQGKGKLFTADGNEWMGTIDPNNRDFHETPPLQDGRDGSSVTYRFGLTIPPTLNAVELYEGLKAEQWRVNGRSLTAYLALFVPGEGLRPQTPLSFFKELEMQSPTFSETVEVNNDGVFVRKYKVGLTAKDGNAGRTSVPNGTYADAIQKFRAREHGVTLDRGSEFLALLANRTYQLP